MTISVLRLTERSLALALLILLSPVLAGAMGWVYLRSGPPALHRSARVGRDGATFEMVKVRTMQVARPGAEWARTARVDDDRVVAGATWLRRHKVDEIPQLWNIVRDEMAFIGPRPELVGDPEADLDPRVLSLLPGLTDLASIRFHDLAAELERRHEDWPDGDIDLAYAVFVAPERRDLRRCYAEQKSIRLDLKIAWRTVRLLVGLSPSGALR